MAQLNDTMIYGDLRVTGKIYGDSISATHTHPASAITAGTFDAARIPAHTATTTAYGAATTANYGHVKITSGNLNGKTYAAGEAAAAAHTHAQYASSSHNHSASEITAGTFDAARIPSLNASKITAGTFDAARIPSLSASKITAGTFDAARIPNLNASKITAGTFDAARIPAHASATTGYGAGTTANYGHVKIISGNLNGQSYSAGEAAAAAHTHAQYASSSHNHSASEITAGTFAADRIPGLNASKITAGTFDAARIPSLNASKITAGTFDAARIPAHASATTGYGAGTTANYGHVKIVSGNMNTSTYSSYSAGVAAAAAHTHSQYLTAHQSITGKEDKSNKVTAWSSTTTDTNYPSEKLVKGALDGKAPTSHAVTATTYGVGTTANYGHVKILSGNMNGKTYAAGEAAAAAHTHSNYTTTDNKVKQNLTMANGEYPIILKLTTTASDSPTTATNYAAGVTVNPSAKTVSASGFIGYLSGTADSVSKSRTEKMTFEFNPTTINNDVAASSCKTYWTNMDSNGCNVVYDNKGTEYTVVFSKANAYGSVVRFGYWDPYPEMLRCYSGTWRTDEWEPITPPQVLTFTYSTSNSAMEKLANALKAAATIKVGNKGSTLVTRYPIVFLSKDYNYFMLTQQYGGSSSSSSTRIYKFTNAGIYGSDTETEIKFTVVTNTSTQESTYTWNIETSTRWKHVVGSIGTDPNTIYYT